jgi:hypothetical protein
MAFTNSTSLSCSKGSYKWQHHVDQEDLSATLNAPIDKLDIPAWCFALPEAEYHSCCPVHCSAGQAPRLTPGAYEHILRGKLRSTHPLQEERR